jgi:hypothetical protein
MQIDGYANSFIYSNTRFCIISNHLPVLFAVSGTWWPAMLLVESMGFGPLGQGDIQRRLQPGGLGLGVHQCDRAQPPHLVHIDGKAGPWARLQSSKWTLMENSSWGWDEAKSMGGTTLALTHSTRPMLPLSPTFEPGARAQAWSYTHDRRFSRSRWRHSRLFLLYSLFIDFYIT